MEEILLKLIRYRRSGFLFCILGLCFVIMVLLEDLPTKRTPTKRREPTLKALPLLDKLDIRRFITENNGVITKKLNKTNSFTEIFSSNTMGMTSVKYSYVRLLSPSKTNAEVGDVLHFMIQAKDISAQTRPVGGDFWFAVLRGNTKDGQVAATACKIFDHNDGTYGVFCVASWHGTARLEIKLVHPWEAIRWLKYWYRTTFTPSPSWVGVFTSPNRNGRELTSCRLTDNSTWSNNMCVYRRWNALRNVIYICNAPENYTCNDFVGTMEVERFPSNIMRTTLIQEHVQYLFNGSNWIVQIPMGNVDGPVKVSETTKYTNLTTTMNSPVCRPDLRKSLSEGFWINQTWHSLVCQSGRSNPIFPRHHCLAGKYIVLVGDSTIRQWVSRLQYLFRIKSTSILHSGQMHFTKPEYNFNLSYCFHPFRIQGKGALVNFSQVMFEEELMERFTANDCRNTILVFGPWTHFTSWPWRLFLDYADGIYRGVVHVRSVCPEMPMFLKSPHNVDGKQRIPGRDWSAKEIMTTLRYKLLGLNVTFLNVWDITLSSNFDYQIHMPTQVVDAEMETFYNYMHC